MERKSFVPRGAASLRVEYDGPPQDYHFLLLPRLTLLAFTSAIEPLRVANQVAGKELYRWFVSTIDGEAVSCSCGVTITPDTQAHDLSRSDKAFVCAGIAPLETALPRAVTWVNRQWAHGIQVGGICTGAFALARAGRLTDRRFTLHWENQPAFRETFPGLEPTGHLYEEDGGLFTCGGGSAATDMMLEIIERDHGPALAAIVADMCLHRRAGNRSAPQRPAYAAALGSHNPQLIAATDLMAAHIEDPLDISEVAADVGLSRRQLERHFTRYLAATPAQYYLDLRIARAHALLNETRLSIGQIAAATGFASASQLAGRFRKRYGTTPQAYRRGTTSK
ncbi:AraC family transcriptional regulator [Roseovarius atlanticus]|uniref:AraC family transcriptional regulator n=1 Tax=Roseovarius atlanticus TaxID=1641875 RepID=A0A0T5P0V0_9RHOB|nr:GlxA family transcriptional regulator [Roseovarius atlanticus]KRS14745.1 AraC family transcriptional regulator [Roseovarius atlanticus]